MYHLKNLTTLLFVLCFSPSLAAENSLNNSEIHDALSGKLVISDQEGVFWSQYFGRDGKTEYSSGSNPTIGYWEARGDQYCSVWPPVTNWVCFDVTQSTTVDGRIRLIWISEKGVRSSGLIQDN